METLKIVVITVIAVITILLIIANFINDGEETLGNGVKAENEEGKNDLAAYKNEQKKALEALNVFAPSVRINHFIMLLVQLVAALGIAIGVISLLYFGFAGSPFVKEVADHKYFMLFLLVATIIMAIIFRLAGMVKLRNKYITELKKILKDKK